MSPTRAETARPSAAATTLRLRVQPRASRDEIVGWREPDVLSIRVTAPPVEGEANHAVETLLARALGVKTSAVSVVRGERGRDKIVRISGMTAGEAHARLTGAGERSR